MPEPSLVEQIEDIPAGYEAARHFGDSVFPLICGACGATVGRSRAEQHSAWHQKLWERIGVS